MIRRKPHMPGVLGDASHAERSGITDQDSKDALAGREGTDRMAFLSGDPGGDEVPKPSIRPDHAEGAKASPVNRAAMSTIRCSTTSSDRSDERTRAESSSWSFRFFPRVMPMAAPLKWCPDAS